MRGLCAAGAAHLSNRVSGLVSNGRAGGLLHGATALLDLLAALSSLLGLSRLLAAGFSHGSSFTLS